MGQTGDLDQLREVFRLCIQQHAAHKVGAHFRDAEGTGLAADLLRGNAQRFGGGQQAVDLGIVHRHAVNGDAGILFKELIESRNIMPQLVQLEQRIMQVLKFKVGGQQAALHIVRRVLNGTEIINIKGGRHNNHAAGVLARGALDTGAAQAQAVFLSTVHGFATLFQIFFHITVSRFILQAGYSARLEHIFLAEQLLRIAVNVGLVHAGEVQVDIRLLIAVKAQEGFKRDIVAVHDHGFAADRAFFIRQVKAVHRHSIINPLAVLALGAQVVRRHGVDLRNAGKVRHSTGADRATAAHLVAACVGKRHQLDRNDIQNSVTMTADGIQLFFQAFLQHIRQGVAVITAGVLPGAGAQLILSTLNGRRVGSLGDGAQIVINGSGNLVGVGHADFKGFFLREIAELLQHIRRGAVEQRGLVVSILKAVACLQDRAVNAVLRLLEVNVTGGNHGDMQFFAQLDDGAVEVLDGFDGIHLPIADHELVVAKRLHFQIVIIPGNTQQFIMGLACHYGAVQLACFARR